MLYADVTPTNVEQKSINPQIQKKGRILKLDNKISGYKANEAINNSNKH